MSLVSGVLHPALISTSVGNKSEDSAPAVLYTPIAELLKLRHCFHEPRIRKILHYSRGHILTRCFPQASEIPFPHLHYHHCNPQSLLTEININLVIDLPVDFDPDFLRVDTEEDEVHPRTPTT